MSAQPVQPARYDNVTIALHWTIGIGIIAIAAAELLRGELPKGNAIRETLKFLHNPAGTAIFALVLVRIVWRLMNPAPAMHDAKHAWERIAAKLAHWALYAMMIAIPLLGILFTLARGRPIDFGAFQIVYPLNQYIGSATMKAMKNLHELLGQGILALAFVHAVAALWHQYVRKDGVLGRMLPKRSRTSGARPAAWQLPIDLADDRFARIHANQSSGRAR